MRLPGAYVVTRRTSIPCQMLLRFGSRRCRVIGQTAQLVDQLGVGIEISEHDNLADFGVLIARGTGCAEAAPPSGTAAEPSNNTGSAPTCLPYNPSAVAKISTIITRTNKLHPQKHARTTGQSVRLRDSPPCTCYPAPVSHPLSTRLPR